ncbi:MAG: hypothetical protein ACK4M7_05255 [Burkholderiales bacterium]
MAINLPAFTRFVEKLGFKATDFQPTEENLIKAEKLNEVGFDRLQSLEIMNLDNEGYERIVDFKQVNPTINLDHAINSKLSSAQLDEIIHATYYNYEVEFGGLKDRGKSLVDLTIISDPKLSKEQIRMINTAVNENLDYKELIKTIDQGNPISVMSETLRELRESKLAVHQELRENKQIIGALTVKDLNLLYTAHYIHRDIFNLSNSLDVIKSQGISFIQEDQPSHNEVFRNKLEVHQYLRENFSSPKSLSDDELQYLYDVRLDDPYNFTNKLPAEHLVVYEVQEITFASSELTQTNPINEFSPIEIKNFAVITDGHVNHAATNKYIMQETVAGEVLYTTFNTKEDLFKLLQPYDIKGKIDSFHQTGFLALSNGEELDLENDSIEVIGTTLAYELGKADIEVRSSENFLESHHGIELE